MISFMRLFPLVAVLAVSSAARAMDADDVVRLAKAKVGDEVILAQMKAAKARFVLTADDLVRLKKEGVSDAVLKAMVESAKPEPAGEKAPAPEKAPPAENAPVQPAGRHAPEAPAGQTGTLVLENLDSRDYSVQVDAERGNLFFYKAVSAEGREPLDARSAQVYRLPAGTYRLTWVGGAESHLVKVLAGKESRVALTRTSAEGTESVYISLFEDGERRGGGKLVTLADRAPAQVAEAQPAPANTTVIERHYYTAPPTYTYAAPACYPARGYYGSSPYYYGSSRVGWLFPAISYNWRNGRDRYGIGWGPYGGLGFTWQHRTGHSGFSLGWGW
jgi:hypothetical protein